jgi:hypothetical protein
MNKNKNNHVMISRKGVPGSMWNGSYQQHREGAVATTSHYTALYKDCYTNIENP